MSRLTNKPVLDGDPINAASLNTRFADFNQTTLNEFNVRDAAIDLPQFTTSKFMAPQMAVAPIGHQDWKHAAYNTVVGQTTPSVPHVIRDSGGTPTPLATGGGAGWTISPDQVLRVYWDLSVRPRWAPGNPWRGTDVEWTFSDKVGTGVATCSNGTVCWAFWLQVDVTDASLSNWVDVAGQDSFNTVVTAGRGRKPARELPSDLDRPCPQPGRLDAEQWQVRRPADRGRHRLDLGGRRVALDSGGSDHHLRTSPGLHGAPGGLPRGEQLADSR
jgi:hypothetical protein